jgi:P-type conjugative transfer protein TrbJ
VTLARIRHALLAGTAAIVLSLTAPPASALIVYDPSNYAQNVVQAARALEQINNQIRSLQNEALSLINEARNLTSLPFSALNDLKTQIEQTRQLLNEVQGIAFDVQQIETEFAAKYKEVDMSATDAALVEDARTRWRNSVSAFEDALKVQAGVVENIDGARTMMDDLVSSSQSATGALQAAQAGNQMLALQARQLADLIALLSAQGRAETLEAAERAAAAAQARENMRRFLTPGAGYQPGDARMFH